MPEVLLDVLRIHRPLVNLDDVAATIDEERGRKTQVAMPVKKITIENVVRASEIIRSLHHGKRKMTVARECADFFGVGRVIEIHSEKVESLRSPTCMQPVEYFQVLLANRRPCDPEIQQYRLAAKRSQRACLTVQVGESKIRRSHGREQPGLNNRRELFGFIRRGLRQGHGFSRAIEPQITSALAPEGLL